MDIWPRQDLKTYLRLNQKQKCHSSPRALRLCGAKLELENDIVLYINLDVNGSSRNEIIHIGAPEIKYRPMHLHRPMANSII